MEDGGIYKLKKDILTHLRENENCFLEHHCCNPCNLSTTLFCKCGKTWEIHDSYLRTKNCNNLIGLINDLKVSMGLIDAPEIKSYSKTESEQTEVENTIDYLSL